MTSISRNFSECDLRSDGVIEALKASDQGIIDQVASRIYSKMLGVETEIQDAPDWSKKDEKLKWTLHTLVEVYGGILKMEDLIERVKGGNYEDHGAITDLAYDLKFVLLDLLGLYYELTYSTWNLIDLLKPDQIHEEQVTEFFKSAVKPPPDIELMVHEHNGNQVVLNQALANWKHWCQVYKTLLIRAYDANGDNTIVAFHSLLAVSAHLISASHIGSLLLSSRARTVRMFRR